MGDVLWEMCKWRIAVFKSLFAFALLTYLSHENRLVKSLNDLAQSQGRKPNSMQNLIDPVSGGDTHRSPLSRRLSLAPWTFHFIQN